MNRRRRHRRIAAETISAELKGVGLAKARAIVEYRKKHGPFRSAVLKIGTMGADGLVLDETPVVIAEVDGFKTESVVAAGEPPQLFIGTDDENYGGVLRPLLP